MRSVSGALVVIWLLIGVLAAYQRGYFGGKHELQNCNKTATAAVTIVAGPLNYVGVNPKISCQRVNVPKPSK